MLQTEGDEALTMVDPHMVAKKKDDDEIEVQDGWEGHILPFSLVQRIFMQGELSALEDKESALSDISSVYEEVIDSLDEEEQEGDYLKEGSFVPKELRQKVDELLADVETDEIVALEQYLTLSKKNEKTAFVSMHDEVDWSSMQCGNTGTYTKTVVSGRIDELKRGFQFDEDSLEHKLLRALEAMNRESELKKEIRELSVSLHASTKDLIEHMSHEDAIAVLSEKWIMPLVQGIGNLPDRVIESFISKLEMINKKYKKTYAEVGDGIDESERKLTKFLSELQGNDYVMQSFHELITILGGHSNE